MWYVQGGMVAVRTVGLGTQNSELGVRDSEFLSVVRSMADGLWCKDYFAADVGHVCHRDSVVGSRSWGRAWRREGRPRSAVGDEERERETRWAQNGTERVNGVLFNCLTTYTGMSYILWASRRPCGTYKAGWWLCAPSDSELGTRSSGLGVPLGSAEHGCHESQTETSQHKTQSWRKNKVDLPPRQTETEKVRN